MKVLVVGTGSIGTRHAGNLAQLGHEVYAVDVEHRKLESVAGIARKTFSSLDAALNEKPDAAFICTHTSDHLLSALRSAEAGCHLFVEKPLSMNLEGAEELASLTEEKELVTMVGCNMRFHPAIASVHKELMSNSWFKKKLWAGLEFGFYLPFVRKDYESSYMAKSSLGGNIIFDVIHELDYAVWFFGEPEEVICSKGILSGLKIDTSDYADMIVKFNSGVVCAIHMDYLQHGYSRRCKVVCENATIQWDFESGRIGTVTSESGEWNWKRLPLKVLHSGMYLDEVRYFLDCVEKSAKTFNSIRDSIKVLKLAEAAEKSSISLVPEKVNP